ncbi:palmitoyltransferase ZDHHC13 [Camelus ferus]|nr:palmitoyltransferase ZDHHC13 [Camelus ferus]
MLQGILSETTGKKRRGHTGFGRHGVCARENQELAKAREALPLIEDSSNCDIVKATQFYISKGAVVDQLGGDLNSTPLHWAIRQGHLPMVILLLQYGADPTLIDGEGFSSIHLAVLFQRMPIIAYLISKGQSVNMTDLNGQTPLMLSAHKVLGPEPTGFLLKFNPSLNVVDKIHQNTPLHWAVAAGNVNAVDKLLEAGSSLDIRNVKGETPLDMALQNKNRLIIHMLKTEAKMRANKNFRLWRWLQKCETWATDPGFTKASEEEKKMIAFLGLTSHEKTSLLKQSRHMKQTLSLRRTPYNLGFTQNLADFFRCGCFGLVKPCAVDWTSQYTMVFHPAKEKVLRSV